MSKRDYYEVLGVERDVSEKDLKKAYRRVAMKFHPDRNPNNKEAEDNFKEASEAYEILADPQKRSAYDQFGHAGVDPSQGGMGAGAGGFGNFSDIFGDVFGDIFGGGGGRQQRGGPSRGSDLRYTLELDLEQAVKGTTAKIRVPTLASCSTCGGSGAKAGTKPTSCTTCGGMGAGANAARLFLSAADLSELPGQGHYYQRPVPGLSWPRSSGGNQNPFR